MHRRPRYFSPGGSFKQGFYAYRRPGPLVFDMEPHCCAGVLSREPHAATTGSRAGIEQQIERNLPNFHGTHRNALIDRALPLEINPEAPGLWTNQDAQIFQIRRSEVASILRQAVTGEKRPDNVADAP